MDFDLLFIAFFYNGSNFFTELLQSGDAATEALFGKGGEPRVSILLSQQADLGV